MTSSVCATVLACAGVLVNCFIKSPQLDQPCNTNRWLQRAARLFGVFKHGSVDKVELCGACEQSFTAQTQQSYSLILLNLIKQLIVLCSWRRENYGSRSEVIGAAFSSFAILRIIDLFSPIFLTAWNPTAQQQDKVNISKFFSNKSLIGYKNWLTLLRQVRLLHSG